MAAFSGDIAFLSGIVVAVAGTINGPRAENHRTKNKRTTIGRKVINIKEIYHD